MLSFRQGHFKWTSPGICPEITAFYGFVNDLGDKLFIEAPSIDKCCRNFKKQILNYPKNLDHCGVSQANGAEGQLG